MVAFTHTADARRLLLAAKAGVLSTLSLDVPGFPFGSVVPYCLDRGGLPLILVADIAQHTRNLLADPRASLTVPARRS
jgi:putative heme iron utilization protein